jgi:hypothetical protein
MDANFPRFRINHPDFFGAVSKILLDFAIELRGGVGVISGFDGDGGRAFEVAFRIGALEFATYP